jgi:hypothetical protein
MNYPSTQNAIKQPNDQALLYLQQVAGWGWGIASLDLYMPAM